MNYTLFRDGQQYGPYTLSDLQRYVSSGDVLLTDMATSEGMSEPVPVSQIVGNISVPAVVAATPIPAVEYPNPPNMHWGLVLLFTFLTWGLFEAVWGIVLSSWLKKAEPSSKALYFYIAEASFLGLAFLFAVGSQSPSGPFTFLRLAGIVCSLIGRFSFRSSMEEHYNNVEGIPLVLNSGLTFFFTTIYFQYHVNDIMRRKKAAQLDLASIY